MWLTEGCGGRRRAVVTPNRESRKEKKIDHLAAKSWEVRPLKIQICLSSLYPVL